MFVSISNTKKIIAGLHTYLFCRFGVYVVLFVYCMQMLEFEALAETVSAKNQGHDLLETVNIELTEFDNNSSIKNLGTALQRHPNGRIKVYFQAGQIWQVGEDVFSLESNLKNGTYVAKDGIKITMLDKFGNKELWINAEKACVTLDEETKACAGKCYGSVKLESPKFEMSGTNLLLLNNSSTNVFTIENNASIRIKNIELND